MAFGISETCLLVAGLAIIVYYYLVSTYGYWKSRGVKGPKPIPIFGTVKELMLGKHSVGDYCRLMYNEYKNEKYCGLYERQEPLLLLHDLDLVKNVLIKDFSKFVDRGTAIHEKAEPLTAHLFNLEAKRWRPLRSKLSPVFTSGKLKQMFYLLVECAQYFSDYLDEIVDRTNSKETIVDVREFAAKFTTDVIGICAFGLQMNAMADQDSPFRVMGRRIFAVDLKKMIQFRIRELMPNVYSWIGHYLADREMTQFFIDTTRQTMEYRKKNSVVKHDFVDLLMAVRDNPDKVDGIDLNDQFLAAQLFVFFAAGFETSASSISNTFYELALHPEVQKKLREEIKSTMKKTGGAIDYEIIKSMKYLDMVFQETLRKYPSVTVLMRKTMEPYTFEDSEGNKLFSVDKGCKVWIPIYGIQRDSKYYPNPEVYDPERFSDEAVKSRHPMAYLPFGDGPRNCIGKRFGVMQTKVGLVKILNRYRIETCERTTPYTNNPRTFLLTPNEGVFLKMIRDE